jgi:hypothetical protein
MALKRTAKSCGPDAPTLASSSWEASFSGMTVAKKPGHRGEREGKPLKPLRAGMPGDPGVLVVATLVCHHSLHTRLRVQRAPGIPHALGWAEGFWLSPGALASRGANARPKLK